MQHNSLLTTVDIKHNSRSFIDNFNFVTSFFVLFMLSPITASSNLYEEIISRVEESPLTFSVVHLLFSF